MTANRATISDVARAAGVSKGLVSLALNDRPGVAAATRDRILQAAAELGFGPNLNARSLTLRTSFALGLVIRRPSEVIGGDPFFPAFISGVESVLSEIGLALVLSVVPDEEAEARTYRSLARDKRVDGVFLSDLRVADPRPALVHELGLPAISLGHPETAGGLPVVNQDDAEGISEAVRHLIGLGHTRIAHVTGDQRMLHGVRRRGAFVRAIRDAGLSPELIMDADFSAASGAAATAALLGLQDRPSAIVYANDLMAIAGLAVLQREGLRVPDDISITGFDAIDLSEHVHPALTTVATAPWLWGQRATRTLLESINGVDVANVELAPARLIPRTSSAAPRPER